MWRDFGKTGVGDTCSEACPHRADRFAAMMEYSGGTALEVLAMPSPHVHQQSGRYHFQRWNVLYAGASVMLSIAGFAGQHSTLRAPISVEAGFVAALVTFLGVCVHIAFAVHERNAIDRMIDAAARRQGVPTAF